VNAKFVLPTLPEAEIKATYAEIVKEIEEKFQTLSD
jgi:hypothetical protein